MQDENGEPRATRRSFLKAAAGGAGAAALARTAPARAREAERSAPGPPPAEAAGGLFDAGERAALARLADLVLPGAGAWGAADYVEGLLTAFDTDPPRIYAGMVGSGDEVLPLDRVRERAWRLRILGSGAVPRPGEELLGPVAGLRPTVVSGVREAAARFAGGAGAERVWWQLPGDFRESFTELVIEASLGDPIYGGNRDGAAWRAFHFEGALLAYGSVPPSGHAGHHGEPESVGPDPLGWFTRAALWAMGFFSRRIA